MRFDVDWGLVGIWCLGGFAAFCVAVLFVAVASDGFASAECIKRGFPESRVLWRIEWTPERKVFCIKRQDQSDVVVPLEEIDG